MKKLIDFFKRLSIPQIALIIGIFGAIIVYFMSYYVDNHPTDAVTSLVSNTVKEFKDKAGETRAKVETNKSNVIVGIDPAEHQKALKALGIKEKQLLALTNIQATLKDSVKLLKVSLDESNSKVWEWESKKPSGSVIKSVMSEKDSVLHTEVDIKLNTTDYVDKGGIFKKDRYYTDLYSPDQNIKINGAQTFRKEIYIRPKRLGVGFQAGYGITSEFKVTPYVGVGISYNFINF